MYKAVVDFTDLQDNNRRYHAGDEYPRVGLKPTAKRIEELLTDKNRRHMPVIAEVKKVFAAAVVDEVEKPVEKSEEKTTAQPKKGGKKKTDVK